MEKIVAAFILGFASGLAVFKWHVQHVQDTFSLLTCDYCQYSIRKQELKAAREVMELMKKKKSPKR